MNINHGAILAKLLYRMALSFSFFQSNIRRVLFNIISVSTISRVRYSLESWYSSNSI